MGSQSQHEAQVSAHSALEAQFVEAIAVWCKATQGGVSLRAALRKIGPLFGAEICAISRIDYHSAAGRERVISHDRGTNYSEEAGPIAVSFATAVCGRYLPTAKPGTVWIGDRSDVEENPRLASVARHRRLAATLIIPIEQSSHATDALELHFVQPIEDHARRWFETMGTIIANAWRERPNGLLSEGMLEARNGREPAVSTAVDFLAIENPCRLSRAEFRVCLLLSRGLNNDALREELSIGLSTLRTHLRNIYAKTGTASQAELVHRLLSGPRDAARSGRHVA